MAVLDKFIGVNRIFRNPEVLKESHIPSEFLFRDEEKKSILDEIIPLLGFSGVTPNHIYIYGPPSTGKTQLIIKTMNEINDYSQKYDENIKLIYTSFKNKTYVAGINDLIRNNIDESIPTAGIPLKKLVDMIGEYAKGKTLGIIFDEVDKMLSTNQYPNPIDTLLGTFTRFYELYKGTDTFLIVISNDDIHANLSPSTKSTFIAKRIYFRAYNADELYKILKARCEQAFNPGVIDDLALINLVQKLKKIGDLRLGLKTLISAGKIAYRENKEVIDAEIINLAFEDIQKNIIGDKIRNSTDVNLQIVYYTAVLQKRQGEATMKEVYDLCKKNEPDDFLSYGYVTTTVIPKLEEEGLIISKVRGLGRGKGKSRFLFVDDAMVDYIIEIGRDEIRRRWGNELL